MGCSDRSSNGGAKSGLFWVKDKQSKCEMEEISMVQEMVQEILPYTVQGKVKFRCEFPDRCQPLVP